MKDLTIFILTHNRGTMLLETIESVLNQTCHDFRFIVSDNSNNDETEKLLQEHSLLGRFEYRKRDHEYSSLDHFNMCLAEVNTKYFVLFHDDDIMMPEYVETMYAAINGSPYIAVGCNAYKLFDTKLTNALFLNEKQKSNELFLNSKILSEQYCKKEIVPYPSYMYSKELLGNTVFSDECGKYSDVSWLLRLTKLSEIIWIKEPLMYYRIHKAQDSKCYDYENQKKLYELFKLNLRNNNKYLKTYECDLLYSKIVIAFTQQECFSIRDLIILLKKSRFYFFKTLIKLIITK